LIGWANKAVNRERILRIESFDESVFLSGREDPFGLIDHMSTNHVAVLLRLYNTIARWCPRSAATNVLPLRLSTNSGFMAFIAV